MIVQRKKIAVFTGTRADYSPLKPVLDRLSKDLEIELSLIVSGSHLSLQFGHTVDEIVKDGFGKYIVELSIPTEDDTKFGMAVTTGTAICKFSEYFKENTPEMLVVLGDRFEAMAVATSAFLMGLPIAHIGGGDVTEGAVDDVIRHCITKMSTVHFPGSEESAKRIIQLGEPPENVFTVGDTSVECCLSSKLLSKAEIVETFPNKDMVENFSIVTLHPVTLENNTSEKQIYALVKAMDSILGMNYLITLANADSGGRFINDIWKKEATKRKNWFVTPSLGSVKYISALKLSKAIIGNSSSGIVEAPVMGVPTVNIGDRQKGRAKAKSIIDSLPNENEIEKAIRKALSSEYQNIAKSQRESFGENTASKQIVEHIKDYLAKPKRSLKKQFHNIAGI